MIINTATVIVDYEGKSFKKVNEDTKEETEITVKDILAISINTDTEGQKVTAEDKDRIYRLSMKLYSGNEVEFTIEELALIKKRVGLVYNALVYGRICDLIEGRA